MYLLFPSCQLLWQILMIESPSPARIDFIRRGSSKSLQNMYGLLFNEGMDDLVVEFLLVSYLNSYIPVKDGMGSYLFSKLKIK